MKLAILTSSEMPNLLPYDMDVVSLLEKRGFEITILIWDDIVIVNPKILNNLM